MYYPDPLWILKLSRENRDLEAEWQELRAFVQEHQDVMTLAGIARRAGVSTEMVSALLIRDPTKTRLSRDFDRLDTFISVFMKPPFYFVPRFLQSAK